MEREAFGSHFIRLPIKSGGLSLGHIFEKGRNDRASQSDA